MRSHQIPLPIALVLLGSAFLLPARGAANQQASGQEQENRSTPLYRITVVGRTTKAVNYLHSSGPTRIDFRGTPLLPYAKGQARVESKRGAVRIQAQFDHVEPATQFGPEYLTYVLWAISPEGRAANLGELLLQGGKGKLDASTQLQAFALIATAEPYFAVSQPSDVVVMENIIRPDTLGSIQEMDAKFDLLKRGQYAMVSGNAQPAALEPGVPLSLYEARNAVRIAKELGAERYANDSFHKAEQLLAQAETYGGQHSSKTQVEMTAREAVQTAEDARSITAKRREEELAAQERQAAQEREARAKAQAEQAESGRLQAQLAAERAAREKAEAETAALKAREQGEQAARERAEAEAARSAAQKQQQEAEEEATKARQAAEEAERQRQQAEAEKGDLRARLLKQLNMVLQTQDTVRGLIVNMSDVLFDTGRFTLRPEAREKLARISGILLAYPGLKLQIEGHTDSVGSEEFNQRLSEQRAGAVRDYLAEGGVSSDSVTVQGFGKTRPVASNDTREGRQQNRRVEIVVTGDSIGAAEERSSIRRR